MNRSFIYKKAVSIWGAPAQLDMVVEECAELIQAINKFKREKKDSRDNLLEEIADVEIMIGQLRFILESDKEIEQIKEVKMLKIRERLGLTGN